MKNNGDIKLSDKIQPIKKDTKTIVEDNVSLQEAIKKEENKYINKYLIEL